MIGKQSSHSRRTSWDNDSEVADAITSLQTHVLAVIMLGGSRISWTRTARAEPQREPLKCSCPVSRGSTAPANDIAPTPRHNFICFLALGYRIIHTIRCPFPISTGPEADAGFDRRFRPHTCTSISKYLLHTFDYLIGI